MGRIFLFRECQIELDDRKHSITDEDRKIIMMYEVRRVPGAYELMFQI